MCVPLSFFVHFVHFLFVLILDISVSFWHLFCSWPTDIQINFVCWQWASETHLKIAWILLYSCFCVFLFYYGMSSTSFLELYILAHLHKMRVSTPHGGLDLLSWQIFSLVSSLSICSFPVSSVYASLSLSVSLFVSQKMLFCADEQTICFNIECGQNQHGLSVSYGAYCYQTTHFGGVVCMYVCVCVWQNEFFFSFVTI